MEQLQNYELADERIKSQFQELLHKDPKKLERNICFSWSNWVFGQEKLSASARRLHDAGIGYIELHGNRYGEALGYKARETRRVLTDNGIQVSGICGMFSPENDLSSTSARSRQEAIDYIKRNVELGHELGASYFLMVPGAVGRPIPIDEYEMDRSVETLSKIADVFVDAGIKGAIEPIRAAEVSFCHTCRDAEEYIQRLDHPGIQSINADIYHMHQEEKHIGEALLKCNTRLVNLHLADSNRNALGEGMVNLDIIIMSLYLIGHCQAQRFVTGEPLGSAGNPYLRMYSQCKKELLNEIVYKTISYFRKRESILKDPFIKMQRELDSRG